MSRYLLSLSCSLVALSTVGHTQTIIGGGLGGGAPTGAAGGALSGSYPNPVLGNNVVGYANELQAPANTVRSNPTGSTANVQDAPVPSCTGSSNALQYSAGFSCGSIAGGGGGGAPGGSSGQIQYNNSGALGGISALGSGSVIESAGGLNVTSGKTLAATNSITLTGTDGQTYSFPSTSATLARTDNSNSFSYNQTFNNQVALANTGGAFFNTTAVNGYKLNNLWLFYAGPPTISAANFQTSGAPSIIYNGSNVVAVTLSGTPSTSGTISFASGIATHGWILLGSNDLTTPGVSFRETSTTTTSAVISVTGSPAPSDTYQFAFLPY